MSENGDAGEFTLPTGSNILLLRDYSNCEAGRIIELPFAGGKLYTQVERMKPPSGEGGSFVDVIEEYGEVGGRNERFAMKVYRGVPKDSDKYILTYLMQDDIYKLIGGAQGHDNVLKYGGSNHENNGTSKDGTAIFLLELVESRTHSGHITKKRGYATEEALILIRTLADLLNTTDAHQIAHRDIKPQNILVPADVAGGKILRIYPDMAKLFDFDVAWYEKIAAGNGISRKNFAGTMSGTVGFMAPETMHLSVSTFDPPVDRYALGCVALATLTNRTTPWEFPKKTNDYKALRIIFDALKRNELPSGFGLLDGLPYPDTVKNGVKDMVKGLLAKDPDKRLDAYDTVDKCDELLEQVRREDRGSIPIVEISLEDISEITGATMVAGHVDVNELNRELFQAGDLRPTIFLDKDEAKTITGA